MSFGRFSARRDTWRMPPLDELLPRQLTTLNQVWLVMLRAYLIVAARLRSRPHRSACDEGSVIMPVLTSLFARRHQRRSQL